MGPFEYASLASRVVFGAGSIKCLPAELDRLGAAAIEKNAPAGALQDFLAGR